MKGSQASLQGTRNMSFKDVLSIGIEGGFKGGENGGKRKTDFGEEGMSLQIGRKAKGKILKKVCVIKDFAL